MDLIKSIKISTAGMRVQGTRLRVISENIANADSLPDGAGDLPYRRKQVSFKNVLDRSLDAKRVKIDKIQIDKTDFDKKFDPQHPAADKDGYVLVPNVNPLVVPFDDPLSPFGFSLPLGLPPFFPFVRSAPLPLDSPFENPPYM